MHGAARWTFFNLGLPYDLDYPPEKIDTSVVGQHTKSTKIMSYQHS